MVGRGPFFGEIQWIMAYLPIRVGGLGLYSATEATSCDFVAFRAQFWVLQDHILRDSGIYDMYLDYDRALDGLSDVNLGFDLITFTRKGIIPPKAQHVLVISLFSKSVQNINVKFDMTTSWKAVFGCLQETHAQYFLLDIPIDGIGQHISLVEFYTILRYRLMIPLFIIDKVFLVFCKACMDTFGEHVIHCK